VSHSMADLKKLCDVGVVLNDGILTYFDKIDDAIKYYHELNLEKPAEGNIPQSSAIYCDDGNIFDNVAEAAKFYKIRPFAILQALEHNNGSLVYLKKVFWRDGTQAQKYQQWKNVRKQKTLISSDGVIFEDSLEAASFYAERFANKKIEKDEIEAALQTEKKLYSKINVQFQYLSEYQ